MNRICFVIGDYWKVVKGGAELQGYYLAREFVKRGWEVHYVYISDGSYKNRIDGGIHLHRIRKRNFLRKFGSYTFLDYFKLIKILNKINPDVVYQRGGGSYTGICARYTKAHKKKLIWASASTRDFVTFDRQVSRRLLSHIVENKFRNYGIKKSDFIFVQSNDQKGLLLKNFGIEPGRIQIFRNVHPVPYQSFKKCFPPVVVWISNIKPQKQPEQFIRLSQSYSSSSAKFIMVGRPGNRSYQARFEERIKTLDNLSYLGECDIEEINNLLSEASIFVNTSQYEGFPNTFIQAWMREVPVVSLNVNPDQIFEREGIGFHPRVFNQMVQDVKLLIENNQVRKEMGAKAREYAIKNHDVTGAIERIIKIIS